MLAAASGEEGKAFIFRCQRCGAPLEFSPESIVIVCKYCGFPNWTVQAMQYPIIIIPARAREGPRYFRRYLESDPDMRKIQNRVTLKRITTVYVPVYFATVHVTSRYWGRATVTLTKVEVYRDSKGQIRTRTRTKTDVVIVKGVYDAREPVDIVARRSVDETVLGPLLSYFREKMWPPEKNGVPISQVRWDDVKGEVLAAEVSPQDAQVFARDEACDRTYEKVKSLMEDKAKEIAGARNPGWIPVSVSWSRIKIPCKGENEWMSPLTLIPYMDAVYAYEGKIYRAVFAGWDGHRVYGEEPMLASSRMLYYLGALFSGGLLGGGGAAALMSKMSGSLEALLGLGALVLGLAGSYYMGKEALKDVRVEKLGEE